MRVSLGIGCTTISNDEERKSISNERTFRDMWKPEELYAKLKELSDDLAESMEDENICGKTVSIKIKLVTFEVRTRAQTVPRLIHQTEDIYPVAKKLLDHEIKEAKGKLELRLMGVRMSQLQPLSALEDSHQPTLSKFLVRSPAKNGPSTSRNSLVKLHSDEENALPRKTDELSKNDGVIAECPNCGKMVESDKEFVKFNTHIDECLNQPLLSTEMKVSSTGSEAVSSGKRKLRLDDANATRAAAKPKLKARSEATKKITDYLKPS
ncbi:hypothetical protein RvY_06593-2 [Ramazzottius varieornatus]|uniref:DNA-directed DNA polymerase n=1 Tax=Ramazzottius varieornatus TaxID=947166 RepID=A0A1D1UZ55_RAMVA|nr:hypothetical protein RvY_06593-2 [Ramazzottius varieornatus]